MAGDDLDVAVLIHALVEARTFEDAQAAVQKLSKSTKDTLPASASFAESQRVSSREVKILTAEALRSVGATEGAGAAGRLASVAFRAMGDSAEFANLAMAGFGFGLAFLLPRIIELAGSSEKARQEADKLRDSMLQDRGRIDELIQQYPALTRELMAYRDTLREIARDKMISERDDVIRQIADEKAQVKALDGAWHSLLQGLKMITYWKDVTELTSEDDKSLKSYSDTIKAAEARLALLNKALEKHIDLTDTTGKGYQDAQKDLEEWIALQNYGQIESVNAIADEINWRKKFSDEQATDADRDMETGRSMTKAERAELDKRMKQSEDNNAKQLAQDRAAKKMELDEAEAEFQGKQRLREMEAEAIGNTLSALSSLFGKNKAIAIAGAIADTYAAANKSFWMAGGYPWGVAPMVATIAQGLANVANIRKAGFDNPVSDMIAESYGVKWAKDLIGKIDVGFQRNLAQMSPFAGPGGVGNVNNVRNITNQKSTTINSLIVPGFYGPNKTEMIKGLSRDLAEIDRLNERTSMS